ncbi:hypothetical protein Ddc_10523 [Ditylenchus destructor]|nr:hypothetical protein Ddc_10523 [Ditylenchus destructor]
MPDNNINISISCGSLVFVAAPIATIILVSLGIISPWWLFLGCGPLALALCACCCLVCVWVGIIVFENCVPRPAKKNKAITQATPA